MPGIGTARSDGPGTTLASYELLPFAFESNEGQVDRSVRYSARLRGYDLFLTADEAVIVPARPKGRDDRPGDVLRLSLVGARTDRVLHGRGREPGRHHYLFGNAREHKAVSASRFARVEAKQVYPGIDLVYHGEQARLEYDFRVAAHADPRRIRLRFGGARAIAVDTDGNLVVHMAGGDLVQHRPRAYQGRGRSQVDRPARYVVLGPLEAGFEIEAHDPRRPLLIDPLLEYATRLGGAGNDRASGVAIDAHGNAFIVGTTASQDFPANMGTPSATPGDDDVFVAKLGPDGRLIHATSWGGSAADTGAGIAIDDAGSAYVTGTTTSEDFPTVSPLQPRRAGAADAFVSKLSADGSALEYSTYLGGAASVFGPDQGRERASGIAVDRNGLAYVTGDTDSTDFPTVAASQAAFSGARDPEAAFYAPANAYVAKLSGDGQQLLYSTYFDADVARGLSSDGFEVTSAAGIAVDDSGQALIAGTSLFYNDGPASTLFVARFGPGGERRELFRPRADSAIDSYVLGARALALDTAGNVYVAGQINGEGVEFLPATPGSLHTDCPADAFEGLGAFVTRLTPALTPAYTTYLFPSIRPDGDPATTSVSTIAVDRDGRVWIGGSTDSAELATVNALQPRFAGDTDGFVVALDAAASQVSYGTYLGGGGADSVGAIAVDRFGRIVVAGVTASGDFPTTTFPGRATDGPATDAFALRLDPASACRRGVLAFARSETVVDEWQPFATFPVTRSDGACGPASVTFDIEPGTARSGIQYRRVRGVLDWTDGDDGAKTFAVPIFDDGLYDRALGARAHLVAPAGVALGARDSALRIVNRDPRPEVSLTSASQRSVRGPTTVEVVAGLSAISGLDTQVLFTFGGTAVAGRDYAFVTGADGRPVTRLTIPARQKTGGLRLLVPAATGSDGSGKTLVVTVRAASGASPRGTLTNTLTIRAP